MAPLLPVYKMGRLQAASSLVSVGLRRSLSPITIETYEPDFSRAIASVIWSRHHSQATCSIFNCGVPNCPLCPTKESPMAYNTEIAKEEIQRTVQQTTARHLPVVNWLTSPSSSKKVHDNAGDDFNRSSLPYYPSFDISFQPPSCSPQGASPNSTSASPELPAKRRRIAVDNDVVNGPEKTSSEPELPHGPRRFAVASNRASRIRRHNGVRRFKCPSCPKAFAKRSVLRTHLRTHTGERPYLCEECNSRFGDLSTLTKHRRTHTDEKPYRCRYEGCMSAFTQSGNLKRHYRTHHLGSGLTRIGE